MKLNKLPSQTTVFTAAILAVVAFVIAGATGCRRVKEPVVVHEIPKSRSGLDELNSPPPFIQQLLNGQSMAEDRVPSRMVVAVAERGPRIWFFKILGPVEQANDSEPGWMKFLGSIEFVDDEPIWELPEGWAKAPGKPERFATLQLNQLSPPLKMAITVFPMQFDPLSNVNRWRSQIGMPPVAKLEGDLTTLAGNGFEFQLFDETGMAVLEHGSGGGMMGGQRAGSNGVPTVETPDASTEIEFAPPAGWEKEESSMSFIRARFVKRESDKTAHITVSEMDLRNGWEDVVGQWSGQAGMETLSGPEAALRTSKTMLGSGDDAQELNQLRLIEPDEGMTKGVVGTMLTRGDTNWFFKLSGDKKLVGDSEEEFAAFLKSFRFVE